nr:DUF5681 domain-containing protein [Nitrosomonas nitrosa]
MSKDLTPHTSGYMKPPKSKRFKKGKSGNPKGGPKAIDDPVEIISRVLSRSVQVSGSNRKVTMLEALTRKLRELALSGDRQAVKLVTAVLKIAAPEKQSALVIQMREARVAYKQFIENPIIIDENGNIIDADTPQ